MHASTIATLICSALLTVSGTALADGKSAPEPARTPGAVSPAPRVVSDYIIGYADFPPASCGYRVAFWMEETPAVRAATTVGAARVVPANPAPAN